MVAFEGPVLPSRQLLFSPALVRLIHYLRQSAMQHLDVFSPTFQAFVWLAMVPKHAESFVLTDRKQVLLLLYWGVGSKNPAVLQS